MIPRGNCPSRLRSRRPRETPGGVAGCAGRHRTGIARRKREQWRLLAEGAPDDATADYLHRYFEPTAKAIDGLEKALAGLGLLDDALALDLRKPQDYFHRGWSTAFRAADLAAHGDDGYSGEELAEACA
ncbi:hypothetical protein [Frankia sp. AgKG'84/4]|uniref:hypothetical protein n=1 Tax=Frankia sp. AgKG'84/4 TaxID=573490 RepID=UPI00200FF1A8|nr:hypothetical protein [Frankia sp. AgKG'84/4]MCL9796021.1 hypothetical protein [Frankia sp. AgKG'84/4]